MVIGSNYDYLYMGVTFWGHRVDTDNPQQIKSRLRNTATRQLVQKMQYIEK